MGLIISEKPNFINWNVTHKNRYCRSIDWKNLETVCVCENIFRFPPPHSLADRDLSKTANDHKHVVNGGF